MKKFTFQSLFFLFIFSILSTMAFAQPIFNNKIPIPPLLDVSTDTIRLEMRPFTHNFNPSDPNDSIFSGHTTWAYNLAGDSTMTFFGPTLKWYTGQQVNMQVTNLLPDTTTTHWHGAEVPYYYDGGPHQPIYMGETWDLSFPNLDSACTMWYHPHLHNKTIQQVSRGLSGMIISEQPSDQIRPTLPHTYGVDDIPLIISDVGFKADTIADAKGKRPYNIVNGVTNPYVEVPNAVIRFRMLNGSTRKGMQFAVSSSPADTSAATMRPFILIATDGGYTITPDTLRTIRNGPGGREEIIFNFSNYLPGSVFYIRNMKHLLTNHVIGGIGGLNAGQGGDPTNGDAFIQIRIVSRDNIPNYTPVLSFQSFTSAWDPGIADTVGVTRRRTKNLQKSSSGYNINGNPFEMMTINDTICVGAKEIWTIHNQSNAAHPFHIHKIFFRILDVVDSFGVQVDLEELGLDGPKDDVLVMPGWKLRFLAKFDDYPSPIAPQNSYMYHCHILTHEDAIGGGMMQQFVVTDDFACNPVSDKEQNLLPKNAMNLFPNPATNQLFMEGSSADKSTIRLVDIQGRVVKEQQLTPFEGIVPIDISNMPAGFYFVHWQTNTGLVTKKVVLY